MTFTYDITVFNNTGPDPGVGPVNINLYVVKALEHDSFGHVFGETRNGDVSRKQDTHTVTVTDSLS